MERIRGLVKLQANSTVTISSEVASDTISEVTDVNHHHDKVHNFGTLNGAHKGFGETANYNPRSQAFNLI